VTLSELKNEVNRLGIRIGVKGSNVSVAPKEKLTPDILNALRQHKQALLTLLEPSRTPSDEGCPSHWLHIPVLPPKGWVALTTSEDGQGLRYRVQLFGKWYIVRFCPHISETHIEVSCTAPKRRMFADFHEFYRWTWAENFYSELRYREVN
jgi:TubC N-terminal docking domain